MKPPVIIKLGGSAITDKSVFKSVNINLLEKIARELVGINKTIPILFVHGGGSFGHPIAQKYNIQNGFTSSDQLDGFVQTRIVMNQLNQRVIETFVEEGLPVVSVHPASCVITHHGRIQTFFTEPIKKLLQIGIIPVLFGDVVMDTEMGFAILSGDQLIVALATSLQASHIVVGLTVDGLFQEDPSLNPTAKIIEKLALSDIETGLESAKDAGTTDVTGGMRNKIEEAIPALEANIPVIMINLNIPKRLVAAIQGKKTRGTYLYP